MSRLMIVDGNNQYLRAYIVNPTLSPNGQPIGGVVGFLKILQKLSKEINPDQIIITWDGEGGSNKRKSMNKNYKEGRSPIRLNRDIHNLSDNEEFENKVWQQTRLAEYLNQLPIIQFLYPSVEADDIISYIATHPNYADWQKVIVSSDKDFIQLINDKTILFRPIQEQILNVKKVVEEYNIHPFNFALARSVCGDMSDNLEGIKGIGLATMAKRFPILAENKSYFIKDLTKYSEDKKGSVYQKISDNAELIKKNYEIMQLSSPQITIQTKMQIDNIVKTFTPEFNNMEFKKMSIQDGFGVVDFTLLFSIMKRFVINK